MRKLKLEINGLRVESFDTAPTGGHAGTVHAHVTAYYELCSGGQTDTCPPTAATCEPTCNEATCYTCPPPTGTCPAPTGFGAYTCEGFASCDPALCNQTRGAIC
jgi:hypothetical protein